MSIRADRWIIAEAAEGMITNFESGQVKEEILETCKHCNALRKYHLPWYKKDHHWCDEKAFYYWEPVIKKCISYGTSSFGYDFRLGTKFRVFSPNLNALSYVDPKNFDEALLVDTESTEPVFIPAHSYMLGYTYEYFKMPRDVMGVCLGKSTYARCGLILNTTPIEPGWEGHITLEISNSSPLPAKVYPMEGIGQLLFFQSDIQPFISYADRAGKYQNQKGIVTARV